MMHTSLYQEVFVTPKAKPLDSTEGESEKVKCLKEISEAGPSSNDPVEPVVREPDKVTAFWASTRPVQDLRRFQREDADIGPIVTAIESGKRPSSQEMVTRSPACRHYRILWDSLVLRDGILFKKFLKKDKTGEYLQFIVPSSLKKEILFQMHDSLLSGHLGC